MKSLLFSIFLIIPYLLIGQDNLIVNPSFDRMNADEIPQDYVPVPDEFVLYPGVDDWYIRWGSSDYFSLFNDYLDDIITNSDEFFGGVSPYDGQAYMGFRSRNDWEEHIEGQLVDIDFENVKSFQFSARIYNRVYTRDCNLIVYFRNSITQDSQLVASLPIDPTQDDWFLVETSFSNTFVGDFDRISVGFEGTRLRLFPPYPYQYHLLDSLNLTAEILAPEILKLSSVDTIAEINDNNFEIPFFIEYDQNQIDNDPSVQDVVLNDFQFNIKIDRFLYNVIRWDGGELINSKNDGRFISLDFEKDEVSFNKNEKFKFFSIYGNVLLSEIPKTVININEIDFSGPYIFDNKEGSLEVEEVCIDDLRIVSTGNKTELSINETTNEININFNLLRETDVILNINDLNGNTLQLLNSKLESGSYNLFVDKNDLDLGTGLYIINMYTNDLFVSEKLILE